MSVTVTGLNEAKWAVERLPAQLEAACRKVARDTALRVKAGARARVSVDTGITRDSIDVQPDVENSMYRVGVFASPPHVRKGGRTDRTAFLPNLALWIERGTRFKSARPFLRPALDAENERYKSDFQAAVERTAAEALK